MCWCILLASECRFWLQKKKSRVIQKSCFPCKPQNLSKTGDILWLRHNRSPIPSNFHFRSTLHPFQWWDIPKNGRPGNGQKLLQPTFYTMIFQRFFENDISCVSPKAFWHPADETSPWRDLRFQQSHYEQPWQGWFLQKRKLGDPVMTTVCGREVWDPKWQKIGWWCQTFLYFHPYLGKWSNLMNMFFRWVETTRKTWRNLENWDSPTSKKWKPVSVEVSQVQSCDTVASLRLLGTSLRLNTQGRRFSDANWSRQRPTAFGRQNFWVQNSRSTFSGPF